MSSTASFPQPAGAPFERPPAAVTPEPRRVRPARRSIGDRAPSRSNPSNLTNLTNLTNPPCTTENHHLWKNGRLWWVAFTVLQDGYRQHRVRQSLRTADVVVARRRRDRTMSHYDALPGHEVTCLRRMRQDEEAARAS